MVNQYQRIGTAIEWSRKQMTPFRERRTRTLRQYLGHHYGSATSNAERMPMNMLALAVQTFSRNLAARNPAVTISSRKRELAPLAKKLELTMNQTIEEIDLRSTLATAVFDAIFYVGAVKVGLTEGAAAELHGELHDAGLPFVDAIDPEDLVIDMNASRFEAMQFCGNRYLLPLDMVRDSKIFGAAADGLVPASTLSHNEYGDSRVQTLTNEDSYFHDSSTAYPLVELWDIYLPYDNLMVTFPADARGAVDCTRVLREVEWDGPELGPYHLLSLGEMSGTVMPVPPITNLIDMNDAINRSFRKLIRQLERQKTITVVSGGADEDGNRIMQADDGDIVRVDRPEATREMRFGGPDQVTTAFTVQMRELFSYLAGNLDAMAGLSQTAGTLGQEELIKASSSEKILDMQSRMLTFTKKVLHDVASWVFYDPVREFSVDVPLGDSGISVPTKFKPSERKETEFLELELDIAPVSMQDASPSQRLQTITNAVSNYLLPMAPMLQQQGVMFDAVAFNRQMAELTNTPELLELLVPVGSQPDPAGQAESQVGSAESRKKGSTGSSTRQYTPTGGTRAARDTVMAQAMLGMNPTPQQEQMMQRPGV
jgi:hypothetical protein